MKLRNMGELFKTVALSFVLSLSALAGPTFVDHGGNEHVFLVQIPATLWIEETPFEGHLVVSYPGLEHRIMSGLLSGFSVVSYFAGQPPFWIPATMTAVNQMLSHHVPVKKMVGFRQDGSEETELFRVVGYDYYRLRQVLGGRRDRINADHQIVRGRPQQVFLKAEDGIIKDLAFDMQYRFSDDSGAIEKTKLVPLRDIYFQGPYGLTGTCKTVLTALGIWP